MDKARRNVRFLPNGKIPEARRLLTSIFAAIQQDVDDRDAVLEHCAKGQTAIEALMHRAPRAKPTAPTRSRRVTGQIVRDVLAVFRANPRAACTDVATEFRINPGRVSEIQAGRRCSFTGGLLSFIDPLS